LYSVIHDLHLIYKGEGFSDESKASIVFDWLPTIVFDWLLLQIRFVPLEIRWQNSACNLYSVVHNYHLIYKGEGFRRSYSIGSYSIGVLDPPLDESRLIVFDWSCGAVAGAMLGLVLWCCGSPIDGFRIAETSAFDRCCCCCHCRRDLYYRSCDPTAPVPAPADEQPWSSWR